jgi:CRISPR-associated protein Cst2
MSGTEIRSVSICGQLTLDMHALNNEGTEGNQLMTRMVHIVDGDGRLAVVNAVSGDMLKHIFAEHFQAVATEAELPLCAGCQSFDANRVNADRPFIESLGRERQPRPILDGVIQRCALDDVAGVLITEGNRSTPRKSTVEFGWLVGIPERTRTESYFHVKYDPERGAGSGDEEGANRGQAIFYRPASSGVYAAVANVEVRRVGFNDVSRQYVVPADHRRKRVRSLLQAIAYTFLKPNGAHRNTQLPHILGWRGIVSVSTGTVPAPTASPLSDDFAEQVMGVADELNRLAPGTVSCHRFSSQAEFAAAMATLAESA